MNALNLRDRQGLDLAIHDLIDRFGLRAIVTALLRRALARPAAPPRIVVGHMSDRMRADIGLPPAGPARPVPFQRGPGPF